MNWHKGMSTPGENTEGRGGQCPFLAGYSYHCQPCSLNGLYEQAKGFCVDCDEYLCRDCYRVHRIPSTSRGHTMLDRESMGKPLPAAQDLFGDQCPLHKGRSLLFYCQRHDVLACQHCKAYAHQGCQDICRIPDSVSNIENSQELSNVKAHVDHVLEKCQEMFQNCQTNILCRKKNEDDILTDVKSFRHEINKELDKLEKDMVHEVRSYNTTETLRLEMVFAQARSMLQKVRQIKENFNLFSSNGQTYEVFRGMKNLTKLIPEMEEAARAINKEITTDFFQFQAKRQVLDFIRSMQGLGGLYPAPEVVRATHNCDIVVQTKTDKRQCMITGLTVADDKVVLADNANIAVKVYNTRKNIIVAQLEMESAPWDIAHVNKDQFVVTLPEVQKFVFLTCWKEKLGNTRQINAGGQCYGIAHKTGRLWASFIEPAIIKILDMTGLSLLTFENDAIGFPLFRSPKHLAISEYCLPLRIYVSDDETKTLSCLSTQGKILETIHDDNLHGPEKMIMDTNGKIKGTVFDCGCNFRNIHMISAKSKRLKVLLYQQKSLIDPTLLHLHEATNTLYLQDLYSYPNYVKLYCVTDT